MKYALLLLLLLLAACTTTSTSINTAQDKLSVEDMDSVISIRFVGNYPKPSQITVKQGEVVNLEIVYTTSKSTEIETDVRVFVLDSYAVEQLGPGTSVYTSFVADKKGSFEYGFDNSKYKGVLVVQ